MACRLRHGVFAVLAGAMLAAGLVPVVVAEPVHAQAGPDRWKPCGSTVGGDRVERVEIVLALDRSGSLEQVDPDGTRRRRAVRGTGERLVVLQDSVSRLLAEVGAASSFSIDVALLAFDTEAEMVAGFAPVANDHPSDSAVDTAVATGGDTDYRPAIQLALRHFENSPNAGSGATCRVLVVFTDGILDPFNTASGRNPSLEDRAVGSVSNLLADLCGTDPGLRHYRERMETLGVSTYVAVLRGPGFERGGGTTHLDVLAQASKQAILALTGHGDSPLLEGVSAASGCEAWSEVRAGRVIEIESIESLAAELANAVRDVWLAVRQPRLRCSDEPADGVAVLEGDWPHVLAVRSPGERRLCTLIAPLDGEVVLNTDKLNVPLLVSWNIDDGIEPVFERTLTPADGLLSFDLISDELSDGKWRGLAGSPVIADDVSVEVIAVWRPTPQALWPEQPFEVTQSEWVSFNLPDRERDWLDEMVTCRVYQRAVWTHEAGGARADAGGLCDVKAPPAGEFQIALASDDANRLLWAMTLAGDGVESNSPALGEPVYLAPGDAPILLGARSQILDVDDIPTGMFTDGLRFELTWRAPDGEPILEAETLTAVEIEVRPSAVELVECATEPEVVAALESPDEPPALIVDTGCRLLSQPGGTVGAAVTGDLGGVPWRLAGPPTSPDGTWPTRGDLFSPGGQILLEPAMPDIPLFVAVEHPDLSGLRGGDAGFTLVAERLEQGAVAAEPQRVPRRVSVYLPFPRCSDRVEAVRVDVEAAEGGAFEQRARARNLCEVTRPPSGQLEIRVAAAGTGGVTCWGASGGPVGRPACGTAHVVEAGDGEVRVGAFSGSLPEGLVEPAVAALDVEVVWESAEGRSQVLPRRVAVAIPEPSLNLIECDADTPPRVTNPGDEIPEGPLIVDTGCIVLQHPAGALNLSVEGAVAGVPWRLEEPVSLQPGEGVHRVLIGSDGPLPNESLRTSAGFELVAELVVAGHDPEPDRGLREVAFGRAARIRLRCDHSPAVVWDGPEVPEGPLVVDTGCTLLAPAAAGSMGVLVQGEVAGVPWRLAEPVRLLPGDGEHRILIRSGGPIPNRHYDGSLEFELTAVSAYQEDGRPAVQQAAGTQADSLTLSLRARPNVAAAIPIAAGLLAAALVLVWSVLWLWKRRSARLPEPSDLLVHACPLRVGREGASGSKLPEGWAAGLREVTVTGSRRRLAVEGLTLRLGLAPWNLRRLMAGDGDPVALEATGADGGLLEWRAVGGPQGGFVEALRDGGVVVLVLEPSEGRPPDLRGRLWLLRVRGSRAPRQNAVNDAATDAVRSLARRLPKNRKDLQASKG